MGVYGQLSKQNFAVQGNQAAAVALWVLMCNWQQPQQAVMLAASLGGNSGTTAAATGVWEVISSVPGAGKRKREWVGGIRKR